MVNSQARDLLQLGRDLDLAAACAAHGGPSGAGGMEGLTQGDPGGNVATHMGQICRNIYEHM